MNKKKLIKTFSALLVVGSLLQIPVFAGTWEKSTRSWKYLQDDGTYVTKGWKYIDGEWYHFSGRNIDTNEIIFEKTAYGEDSTKPKYFVGADGKMIKNGWYKQDDNYSWFVEPDGKVIEGWFMVDRDLYRTVDSNEYAGLSRAIHTSFTGTYSDDYIDKNGNRKNIDVQKANGKVINYGNLLNDIQYVPIYNSQGVLVGEIKN